MPDQMKLLGAIDSYSAQSYGSGDADNGELSRQRSLALDGYAGKMLDVPPKGRSQVNDRSIFETVQWIMPSMMRIFAGGDNVVEFDPTGPEDEEVAEQESDYLNYIVTQKNDWDLTVREFCQDALLTKNAYCLVDMEEKLIPEVETYEGQTEEQVTLLLEDDMEIIGQNQYDDPNDTGMLIDPANGAPIPTEDIATQAGAMALYAEMGAEPQFQYRQLFDVQVKRVTAKRNLVFQVLPPERVRVAQDTSDFTLADCNYFEYEDPTATISDLRKLGYDVSDELAGETYDWTREDASRDEPYQTDLEVENTDPSMKQVNLRTIWIRHDYDEDGLAELQKVVLVGREVLEHEPASRIPVACIVPFINTHRHIGNSVADLVFEIQRIKTSLLRGGLDALNLANNPRHAVSRKVHIDDLLHSASGGVVRMLDSAVPGEGHILPLQTENTFPFAQQGLEYMDRVIESRVGVNRMFQGIDSSNINDHDRIGQLSTMAAQRVEDIARLFGTGFKRLFSLAHEALIKSGGQQEKIKLRGNWVEIDPTQWRTGRDMRVVAPFAAGNKDSLLQRLLVIANIHEKALAGGLPIVDAQDAYNLALEIGKAADLPATKFFTDPSTIPPPEPQPDYTGIALEIENKKADNQAADSQLDAEIKKYETDTDAAVKELTARIQSETQIALAQLKAGQAIDLEQFKANLRDAPVELNNDIIDATKTQLQALDEEVAASIKAVTDAIEELRKVQLSPVKVVRENGKIIGKEVNGTFVPLEDV